MTQTLPANLDAERAILGGVLIGQGKAFDSLADVLTAEDFHLDRHQRIYATLAGLWRDGHPIDEVALKHALQRAGDLDAIGGPAYIGSLTDGVPRGMNLPYYAKLVRDDAARRRVIDVANNLLQTAYDGELDASAAIDMAEQGLLAVGQQAATTEPTTAQALARDLRANLEQLVETRRSITGVSTGFPRLDGYTRGLQPGALVLLAGRPGTGKSSLAMQIALHVALTAPVLFFSVEMANREQGFRAVSLLSGIDSHELQTGQINAAQQQAASMALLELETRQLRMDDSGALTPMQVRSRARRMKARDGLGLVVIDYLQLLQHAKADTREQAVSQTSRAMKQLARELDIPLLVLCQLSRAAEASRDQRPMLSHLRESGALEQDADLVLLIHRPQEQSDGLTTITPAVQLLIAKSRNGPTGEIDYQWDGARFRFWERAS